MGNGSVQEDHRQMDNLEGWAGESRTINRAIIQTSNDKATAIQT